MIENILTFVKDHPFEITTTLISISALVYGARAVTTAKQAMQAAKDSDLTSMRVKAQDEYSAAERSFHKLQEACQLTMDQWNEHLRKQRAPLSSTRGPTPEMQRNAQLEHAGRKFLNELKDAMPIIGNKTAGDFERHIREAQEVAMKIERLRLQLEAPQPFTRF